VRNNEALHRVAERSKAASTYVGIAFDPTAAICVWVVRRWLARMTKCFKYALCDVYLRCVWRYRESVEVYLRYVMR
jgi:hypothetical protein